MARRGKSRSKLGRVIRRATSLAGIDAPRMNESAVTEGISYRDKAAGERSLGAATMRSNKRGLASKVVDSPRSPLAEQSELRATTAGGTDQQEVLLQGRGPCLSLPVSLIQTESQVAYSSQKRGVKMDLDSPASSASTSPCSSRSCDSPFSLSASFDSSVFFSSSYENYHCSFENYSPSLEGAVSPSSRKVVMYDQFSLEESQRVSQTFSQPQESGIARELRPEGRVAGDDEESQSAGSKGSDRSVSHESSQAYDEQDIYFHDFVEPCVRDLVSEDEDAVLREVAERQVEARDRDEKKSEWKYEDKYAESVSVVDALKQPDTDSFSVTSEVGLSSGDVKLVRESHVQSKRTEGQFRTASLASFTQRKLSWPLTSYTGSLPDLAGAIHVESFAKAVATVSSSSPALSATSPPFSPSFSSYVLPASPSSSSSTCPSSSSAQSLPKSVPCGKENRGTRINLQSNRRSRCFSHPSASTSPSRFETLFITPNDQPIMFNYTAHNIPLTPRGESPTRINEEHYDFVFGPVDSEEEDRQSASETWQASSGSGGTPQNRAAGVSSSLAAKVKKDVSEKGKNRGDKKSPASVRQAEAPEEEAAVLAQPTVGTVAQKKKKKKSKRDAKSKVSK